MQIALAEILIKGSLQHSIVRIVTAPEVTVLRDIHGSDAVINVTDVSTVKRSNYEELDRLKLYFTPDVIVKIFPGALPKLPTTFAEVGVDLPKPEKADKVDKADKAN